MAGKYWWERSLLGFPASLARHVKNRSIVPGNNGPWKCARQGCGGLHRKLLLTFSLGKGVLGEAPVVPILFKYHPLSSDVVRMIPWANSGSGQIWWMPVFSEHLFRSPGLSVVGMLTAFQTS